MRNIQMIPILACGATGLVAAIWREDLIFGVLIYTILTTLYAIYSSK